MSAGMKEPVVSVADTKNQSWANDKSKFGYRMLQKMGWSEGKGLGLKEDGDTKSIRVKKKMSNTGIGAEKSAAQMWASTGKVAGGLNDVLARLSAIHAPVSVQQRKTVQEKGRGYFERRAHGKDVNAYSEKDLKEIFGGVAIEAASSNDNSSPENAESTTPEPKEILRDDGESQSGKDDENTPSSEAKDGNLTDSEEKRERKKRKAEKKRRKREKLENDSAQSLVARNGISKKKKSKKTKRKRE